MSVAPEYDKLAGHESGNPHQVLHLGAKTSTGLRPSWTLAGCSACEWDSPLCAGQPLPPQPPQRIIHHRNLQELFPFGQLHLNTSSISNHVKEAEDRVHDLFLGKPSNSSVTPVGSLTGPLTLDVLLV